jgi:predicted anti-sigma-YlaC factor YlaD
MALSARLDAEDPGMAEPTLDAHLDRCAACRAWLVDAEQVTRTARIAPAEAVPDLSAPILAAVAADRRAGVSVAGWRAWLAVVAVAQLVVAVPGLLWGSGADASVHVAHELGSWDVALAVGLLFAAWRPARAWGMLPLVAALVACLMATTGLDMADGHAHALRELSHILELAGLMCLWRLAVPERPRRVAAHA